MLRIKPQILFDFNTGETFKIGDYTGLYNVNLNPTGYGLPNINMSDVNYVRVIFGTYLKEQSANTNATEIIAGTEYNVVGSGSFTYDTKTYNAGDTFISMATGTPTLPTTITLEETGRFQPITNFLPIDITSGDFTPSLLGIYDTVFPDTIGNLQMDIYTTETASPNASVSAGTYIVKGGVGDTITTGGVTYRVGEVFTKTGSFAITGTGSVVEYNDTTVDANGNPDYVYFLFGYHAFQALITMSMKLADTCCNCKDKIRENYVEAMNLWVSIVNQLSNIDGQVDISGAQIKLERIVQLNELSRC